jgi:hypothetical protein
VVGVGVGIELTAPLGAEALQLLEIPGGMYSGQLADLGGSRGQNMHIGSEV